MTETETTTPLIVAGTEVRRLLAGHEPTPGTYPAWQHIINELQAAHAHGGTANVRRIFDVAQRADPAVAALAAQELVADWQHGVVTAPQLDAMEFPPLRWIVQDVLPEGCTLLAGKAKSKKSWLALGIAVAVAFGGKALGHLECTPGTVLYLDLESNQRRMQSRLRAMLSDQPKPDNLHIFTNSKSDTWPAGPDGIARLEEWIQKHPDTVLIVVDILKNIRPHASAKDNIYDADYEALAPLAQFAGQHRLSVLVIHHTRKAKADDTFDEISGSTGIAGAVDNMWLIGRVPGEHGHILHIRGRDIVEDDPRALGWDEYTCGHTLQGDAALVAAPQAQREVLQVMQDGNEYTPADIAEALQKAPKAISKLVIKMAHDGILTKPGYGKYRYNAPGGET
jgi:hypothetical protein